jgi:hypothetical protein
MTGKRKPRRKKIRAASVADSYQRLFSTRYEHHLKINWRTSSRKEAALIETFRIFTMGRGVVQ